MNETTTRLLGTLGVAAGVTVVVGLLTGQGWPGYAVGAIASLALWVMLFFGGYAVQPSRPGWVPLASYARSAALGLVLGFVMFLIGDRNAAFWAPGFIIAGIIDSGVARSLAAERGR